MRITYALAFAVATGALLSSPANAQISGPITDLTTWEAATTGVVLTENFADATLNCGLSLATDAGVIGSGRFNDRVTPLALGGDESTFSWLNPVFAIGGNWNLADPGGPGTGLAITVEIVSGGSVSVFEIPNTTAGGFVGFTSTDPIESMTLAAGTQGGIAETYWLDNLVYEELSEVEIAGVACGVENFALDSSSTLACDVAEAERQCIFDELNHGDFVSCMTQVFTELKLAEVISGKEKGQLTACAAQSDVGKPDSSL